MARIPKHPQSRKLHPLTGADRSIVRSTETGTPQPDMTAAREAADGSGGAP
ncbi:hypothetical protein [Paenibacillus sp. GYB003]|uniref:hypothetical protein n=1 Tax=Paenibacillus sp. GYB003 TaxID=2994392 RepID=UPI002F96A92D